MSHLFIFFWIFCNYLSRGQVHCLVENTSLKEMKIDLDRILLRSSDIKTEGVFFYGRNNFKNNELIMNVCCYLNILSIYFLLMCNYLKMNNPMLDVKLTVECFNSIDEIFFPVRSVMGKTEIVILRLEKL